MAKALYTARAHVTGGRVNGQGRTSDGALDVVIRLPKELGGEGDGTNPEELFAIGFAACFESALGAVARRSKAETGDVAIDSTVMLFPTPERGFKLGVELHVLRDHDTGLMEIDQVMAVVEPFLAAIPR